MMAKRILLPACLSCLMLLVIGSLLARRSAASAASHPGPLLQLSASVHDLGQTSLRREWLIPFEVHNAGGQRLIINETDRDCSCNGDGSSQVMIPPGESTFLVVEFDTRHSEGRVEQTTSFTTSDPALPGFDLTVRAIVQPAAVTSR